MSKALWLKYSTDSTGGEWDENGFRSTSYKTVQFTAVLRDRPDGFFGHDFEVSEEVYSGSQVFLVVVRYRDGDSFGSSHGNWELWRAVSTAEDALKIKQDILSGELAKRENYLPWESHFCRLEDVEIHCFQIGRNGADIQYH